MMDWTEKLCEASYGEYAHAMGEEGSMERMDEMLREKPW